MLNNKITFITGASAGIGYACAEAFANSGSDLVLIARRKDRIATLAKELKEKYGTQYYLIEADVRDYSVLKSAFETMPDEWKRCDILINNAGLARGLSKIQDGDLNDWEEMIDTNIKGVLYTSRIILPWMVAQKSGMVINIGSIAGREVYPMGNVYCATKHALKALSQAMTIDLNGTGVRVCNIDPGLVETEFSKVRFHWDYERAEKVYQGYEPLIAEDIADIALFAATRPARVMIQDIMVTPTAQASATVIDKIL